MNNRNNDRTLFIIVVIFIFIAFVFVLVLLYIRQGLSPVISFPPPVINQKTTTNTTVNKSENPVGSTTAIPTDIVTPPTATGSGVKY